jgi:hypothetical protein
VNKHHTLRWAKSLLVAATFASLIELSVVAAQDDRSINGFTDTAGAFLDVGTFRPARFIVYQPKDGPTAAFTVFQAGGRTFGYAPSCGARYCPVPWGASDSALASVWCRQPVRWAAERTRAGVLSEGVGLRHGEFGNGCLIESLLVYERLPQSNPEANWEGIFILLRGTQELGGGHAVCIYLVGSTGWLFDPIGGRVSCLGRINIQDSRALAHQLDPEATGGWLEARDLAWLRRHGVQLAEGPKP